MSKNEFDINRVEFHSIGDNIKDHEPAYKRHGISPVDGDLYAKYKAGVPDVKKDNRQWFAPIETQNIPNSGINDSNFIVNPFNKENEETKSKYVLFYNNEIIASVYSTQEAKSYILNMLENSEADLEKFSLFKKIPISLELCFEDK